MSLYNENQTRVIIGFKTADGGSTKFVDGSPGLFVGNEDWTAEDWLNEMCATPYVRSAWTFIEVTRQRHRLHKRYINPATVQADTQQAQ